MFNKSEGKCLMIQRVCPKRGISGEIPNSPSEDYCPAWLEMHHRASEVVKLQTGIEIEKREGCAFGLLPFLFSGAITASNESREETIALRREEDLRSQALGQAFMGILGVRNEKKEIPISEDLHASLPGNT